MSKLKLANGNGQMAKQKSVTEMGKRKLVAEMDK